MTTKSRTDLLTTTELYNLDAACRLISRAFKGGPPYLVGTAADGSAERYRDVDVRLMLNDEEFAEVCPTRARWELLCLAIGAYLHERTGLPVDFQIQRTAEANERFHGRRNPLGIGRSFAGGGDGTPEWESPTKTGGDHELRDQAARPGGRRRALRRPLRARLRRPAGRVRHRGR